MDAQSLRAKNPAALLKQIEEAHVRLKELRFKRSSNQVKDVREIRELKRGIARSKTVLAQGSFNEAPKPSL